MMQHIAKVQNMAAQLIDLGESVSNSTIMAKILGSLTTKYAIFQTAWDNVPVDSQNLENLQERLLREEARLSANDEAPGAFLATRKSGTNKNEKESSHDAKKKRGVRDKTKIKCFKCHELGHYARECRNKRRENSDSDVSRSRDCAFVVEQTWSRSPNKVVKNRSYKIPNYIVESVLRANKSESWITDSGAHVILHIGANGSASITILQTAARCLLETINSARSWAKGRLRSRDTSVVSGVRRALRKSYTFPT